VKICGIKLTHDAAVAGIEDGRLLFCVEIEKLANRPRYTKMNDNRLIAEILERENFYPDSFVVDGWKSSHAGQPLAPYHEFDGKHHDPLTAHHFAEGLDIGWSQPVRYRSYHHMTGHIVGSYVTAPFARGREPAFVISFDGGQNPRVHKVDPNRNGEEIAYIGTIHHFYGIIYGIMGYYWGPYKRPEVEALSLDRVKAAKMYGGYEAPGKLMSYIALGTVNPIVKAAMRDAYRNRVLARNGGDALLGYHQDGQFEHGFCRQIKARFPDLADADALVTLHAFLEDLLVEGALAYIPEGSNIIFTGGSALNIKWNSALRSAFPTSTVWVPPFPNDSGSALGVAAAEMVSREDRWSLDWSVYAGPKVVPFALDPLPGWIARPADAESVATTLAAHPSDAVVVLNGRAEIGPRALGNRSILMSAQEADNKARLNAMKKREEFRPVAPICLERYAPVFFEPGSPDPYILFDHHVVEQWKQFLPAILHLDGTARLQTVNAEQNSFVAEVLEHYCALTGFPILCNTSANLNGSGFFPDVLSAMRWGEARFIYSEGLLWEKIA